MFEDPRPFPLLALGCFPVALQHFKVLEVSSLETPRLMRAFPQSLRSDLAAKKRDHLPLCTSVYYNVQHPEIFIVRFFFFFPKI